MKEVFNKLRAKCIICSCKVKIWWLKFTTPFQIIIKVVKRYCTLRKIDKESKNGWERHVKYKELEREDEQRVQFYPLKAEFIGTFFRTMIQAGLQEQLNEGDDHLKEFKKNKEELVYLLEKICNCEGISFNQKIKAEIISWEFGKFETKEELLSWGKGVSEYICTLDII